MTSSCIQYGWQGTPQWTKTNLTMWFVHPGVILNPMLYCTWCEHGWKKNSASSVHLSPLQRPGNVELWSWWFCYHHQMGKQTVELQVIWDAMTFMWRHCNGWDVGPYNMDKKQWNHRGHSHSQWRLTWTRDFHTRVGILNLSQTKNKTIPILDNNSETHWCMEKCSTFCKRHLRCIFLIENISVSMKFSLAFNS